LLENAIWKVREGKFPKCLEHLLVQCNRFRILFTLLHNVTKMTHPSMSTCYLEILSCKLYWPSLKKTESLPMAYIHCESEIWRSCSAIQGRSVHIRTYARAYSWSLRKTYSYCLKAFLLLNWLIWHIFSYYSDAKLCKIFHYPIMNRKKSYVSPSLCEGEVTTPYSFWETNCPQLRLGIYEYVTHLKSVWSSRGLKVPRNCQKERYYWLVFYTDYNVTHWQTANIAVNL